MGTGDEAERQRSDAARMTAKVLGELEDIGSPLRRELSRPKTLPEPGLALDLVSRQGDRVRMVKHVHQMSVGHAMQYAAASEMKVAHLIDAFEALAESGNGLGLYAIARSILELRAQVFDVNRRLEKAQANITAENWLPGAQEFFGVIVRARYATSNDDHRALLLADGASKKVLAPMSVGDSIRLLSEQPSARYAQRRYNDLCDAVHHNLGASTAVTAGSGTAAASRNANGGMMLWSQGQRGTVTAYEYPVVWKADVVVSRIGEHFVEDVGNTLELLARLPDSPFSYGQLAEFTGLPLGFVELDRGVEGRPVRPPARSDKQPRNLPCSCGSGRKHKQCCGA